MIEGSPGGLRYSQYERSRNSVVFWSIKLNLVQHLVTHDSYKFIKLKINQFFRVFDRRRHEEISVISDTCLVY